MVKTVKQLLRCLFAAAIWFAVVGPVGATCGDWLQHGDSKESREPAAVFSDSVHQTDVLAAVLSSATAGAADRRSARGGAADHSHLTEPSTPRPCHGPGCGRAPKTPTAASGLVLTLRRIAEGCLTEATVSSDRPHLEFRRDFSEPKRLAGFPLLLLRPPMDV